MTLHGAHMHCQTTTVEVLCGNQEAAEGGQVSGGSTAVKRTAAAVAELFYRAVGTHPQGLQLVVEHPKTALTGAEGKVLMDVPFVGCWTEVKWGGQGPLEASWPAAACWPVAVLGG